MILFLGIDGVLHPVNQFRSGCGSLCQLLPVANHLLELSTKVGMCEMIRCGNQIRLHQEDIDWLYKLTGTIPSGIYSVDNLNNFVDCHLPNFNDSTPESELLKILLADRKIRPEK